MRKHSRALYGKKREDAGRKGRGDILQRADERVTGLTMVERVESSLRLIPNILLAGAPALLVEGGRVLSYPSET